MSLISLIPSQKYTAIGMLGKATDTLDATGKVTEEKPYGKHKCIYTLDVIWRRKWSLSQEGGRDVWDSELSLDVKLN